MKHYQAAAHAREEATAGTCTRLSDILSTDPGRDFALIDPGQARFELLFIGIGPNNNPPLQPVRRSDSGR